MKYIKILIVLLLISSCAENNKNLISKNQLGELTNKTKIFQIDDILIGDSVVSVNARNAYGKVISSTIKVLEVYDTSGQQILLIKPSAGMDTVSEIKSIRIMTDKYKTKNGLSLGSTYADLKKHHEVGNIQSSLKSFIITLEDINAFVSFDKKYLPGEVRYDMDTEIKPTMIPEDAEINRFWLNFEAQSNVEK